MLGITKDIPFRPEMPGVNERYLCPSAWFGLSGFIHSNRRRLWCAGIVHVQAGFPPPFAADHARHFVFAALPESCATLMVSSCIRRPCIVRHGNVLAMKCSEKSPKMRSLMSGPGRASRKLQRRWRVRVDFPSALGISMRASFIICSMAPFRSCFRGHLRVLHGVLRKK